MQSLQTKLEQNSRVTTTSCAKTKEGLLTFFLGATGGRGGKKAARALTGGNAGLLRL
jgi:hypothetical protein